MLNKNVVTFLVPLHTNTAILVLPKTPASYQTFQMQQDEKSKMLNFGDSLRFLFPLKDSS